MRVPAAIAVCLLALPVLAAPPSVRIESADCDYLTRHQPDADVAYRPGVDAEGNPVVPADLGGGSRVQVPGRIDIPLTVPLSRFLAPGSVADAVGRSEVQVGTLQVDTASGEVLYNGQPLSDPETADLVAACRELQRGR